MKAPKSGKKAAPAPFPQSKAGKKAPKVCARLNPLHPACCLPLLVY